MHTITLALRASSPRCPTDWANHPNAALLTSRKYTTPDVSPFAPRHYPQSPALRHLHKLTQHEQKYSGALKQSLVVYMGLQFCSADRCQSEKRPTSANKNIVRPYLFTPLKYGRRSLVARIPQWSGCRCGCKDARVLGHPATARLHPLLLVRCPSLALNPLQICPL